MMAAAIVGLILAVGPAILFFLNLRAFRRLPAAQTAAAVSVILPARNEERQIGQAVQSVLANQGVELELIVVDDGSEDGTGCIVGAIADPRLRLTAAPPLPQGWCGKQHACQFGADHARHPLLVWIDADVTLAADALARMAAEMSRNHAGLLSGFPRQITRTWLEKLMIPLIHFVLLGYLPIPLMRIDSRPSLGAGCGQLFIARREEYIRAGGHAAIRASMHDGLTLPRAFRRAGIMTDIFDATDIASCRMYRSAGEVWRGLLKNAGEGMAAPAAIVPWTMLLVGANILPLVMVMWMVWPPAIDLKNSIPPIWRIVMDSMSAPILMRIIAAWRYRQSWVSIIFHPYAVLFLVIIQWQSLLLRWIKKPVGWRGRPATS